MRKLIYFVAVSIDGFIGDRSGDGGSFMPFVDEEFLEFLKAEYPETIPAEGRRQLGLEGVENKHFDTVVQGRGSYRLALDAGITSPYGHLREYVASTTLDKSHDPNVEIISGDLVGKIRELKQEESEFDIWLCGGAKIAGELRDEVDELVVKTYPVLVGTGMPMFDEGAGGETVISEFVLDASRVFGNGVVVRTYRRKR
ncbi:dihydrofolate reductase family protein [Streptomyces sp. BA2]|uniref:dihydrofolate reductase family protein n=1 Tax=Streptomyces sp. BA2 TaxID=436595 RepID=UPI001322B23B|nr:dihydrofolate reductase family protein [Streptomyces sp. BA2]MWA13566.1 dihydrofolate reductase [Streptomyces sp. BA2]